MPVTPVTTLASADARGLLHDTRWRYSWVDATGHAHEGPAWMRELPVYNYDRFASGPLVAFEPNRRSRADPRFEAFQWDLRDGSRRTIDTEPPSRRDTFATRLLAYLHQRRWDAPRRRATHGDEPPWRRPLDVDRRIHHPARIATRRPVREVSAADTVAFVMAPDSATVGTDFFWLVNPYPDSVLAGGLYDITPEASVDGGATWHALYVPPHTSSCGTGIRTPIIPPAGAWGYRVPRFTGALSALIRLRVYTSPDLGGLPPPPTPGEAGRPAASRPAPLRHRGYRYSAPYAGSVNPGQLWRVVPAKD